MGRSFLAALSLIALVAGVADASGRTAAVRLRVAPRSVSAGGSVRVAAGVSPAGASCSGTISHASRKLRLLSKNARRGEVSWTEKIPSSAPTGKWTVRLACAHAGKATAGFSVTPRTPPLVPAKIVVNKSGISTRNASGTTSASWGVVLRNVSPDEDAIDVDVTLNFLNAAGQTVRFSTDDYEAIPAGSTYYIGGYDTFSSANPPTRIEVASVQMGAHEKKSIGGLAPVANIHTSDGSTAHVLGDFQNTYDRTISSIAAVTAVCFDAAGNVIGGGTAYPSAAVTPGTRANFDVPVLTLSSAQIASSKVSVEPHFFTR